MVLKTEPDQPVGSVQPSTGELFGQWTVLLSNWHWTVQTNGWTIEPDDLSDFLQTGHNLKQVFVYYEKAHSKPTAYNST